MKNTILLIILCLALIPGTALAQSTVTIWSEDFTGCISLPDRGKNATYKWGVKKNDKPSLKFEKYSHSKGSAPALTLPKGDTLSVNISLYGASGNSYLNFKSDDAQYLTLRSSTEGVTIDSLGHDDCKYSISIPQDAKKLNLEFIANMGRVDLDDIILTAPDNCREQKESPELKYSEKVDSMILGYNHNQLVLSNPNNLDVEYWSSNPWVAKIDENGTVSPLHVGTTIIYAIYGGDDKYSYQEVSYTLTLNRKVPEDEIYFESFDKMSCKGGQDGSYTGESGTAEAFDSQYSNKDANVYEAYKCVEIGTSKIKGNFNIGPIEKLQGNGQLTFLLMGIKNTSICQISISKGSGKLIGAEQNVVTVSPDYRTWSLVTVTFTNASSNTEFNISGQQIYIDSVSIIAYPKDIQLKVGTTGYSSLYYGNYSLKVPEGVNAYTMAVKDDIIDDSHRYAQGEVIPKGTGVIVKAAEGSYTFEVTDEEGDSDPDNQLKGTDTKEMTTGGDVYYMLAQPEGKQVGYYWAAENGGAFVNGAHKAYLALSKEQAAKPLSEYIFHLEDTPTSISTYTIDKVNNQDNRCFNLTGQRINESSYHGIIIKNGKKIIKR